MPQIPTAPDPAIRRAAEDAEGALLMKAENAYLKQRVVALHMQVLQLVDDKERLSAEVAALTPDAEPGADTDPEPGSDEGETT